jgi:hypothetical protein
MRRALLSLFALLACAWLHAQDHGFGIQGVGSAPIKDFNTFFGSDKPGYGGGIHFLFDGGDGIVWRPRADVLTFKNDAYTGGDIPGLVRSTVECRIRIASVGTDLLWYVNGVSREGFYFLGNLGIARTVQDLEGSLQMDASGTSNAKIPAIRRTKVSSIYGLGMGITFGKHLSIEASYVTTKMDANAITVTSGAATLKRSDIRGNMANLGLLITY